MKPGDLVRVKSSMWARCVIDSSGIFGAPGLGFEAGDMLIVLGTLTQSEMEFLRVLSCHGVTIIRKMGVEAV